MSNVAVGVGRHGQVALATAWPIVVHGTPPRCRSEILRWRKSCGLNVGTPAAVQARLMAVRSRIFTTPELWWADGPLELVSAKWQKCSKAGAAAILSPPLAFGQPQGPNAGPRLTQIIVCAQLSRFPRRCDVVRTFWGEPDCSPGACSGISTSSGPLLGPLATGITR